MLGKILLLVVSICTFISYLPQIKQLIVTKSSKDLSVKSWFLWVISMFCYALYTWLYTKDYMLMFTTILEFLFCLIILIMVIIYRKK